MRVYMRGERGIWWVDVTVDGTRVKRSSGTVDEAAAKEWAASLASDLWRQRRLGEAPAVTWDAAVLSWLGENKHLKSLEEVKRNLRWLTVRLQGKLLADITPTVIRALASERKAQASNAMVIARAEKAGQPAPAPRQTSAATVNRHLSDLSRILHHAHAQGWLAAVPAIAKKKEAAKRFTWLTHDEARMLLDELPEHLRAMALLSLATGLRESNVRLLEWSNVDLARGLAWVHADQAKAGKNIAVPLNDVAVDLLVAQRGKSKRWVFPVMRLDTGTATEPTGKISNHAWRKACIRAGFPTLRFHDLRHTWASWHVQSGTPLAVLQELGGWASLTMVQRYAHLGQTHVSAWAGNIGGGTSAVQVDSRPAKENGPEGPSSEVNQVGWLMGLEPTTTRITRRSRGVDVLQINDLRASKKPKAA
jgi:integrase